MGMRVRRLWLHLFNRVDRDVSLLSNSICSGLVAAAPGLVAAAPGLLWKTSSDCKVIKPDSESIGHKDKVGRSKIEEATGGEPFVNVLAKGGLTIASKTQEA